MKLKLGVGALVMMILLMNCETTKLSTLRDQDAVAESAFIYQMDHHPLKKYQQTYFLNVENNRDPDEGLIVRLRERKYPVKAASQSEMLNGLIQDKESKVVGILISIRNRTCISSEGCAVEARVYEDTDNIEGWRYDVTRENNVWVVKKAELISIT